MIQGNRRLHAQRIGRNPQVRNDRRYNGQVRDHAPSPNAQIQQPNASPQQPELSTSMDSLLSRVDAMRRNTPSISITSGSGGREPTGGQATGQATGPGLASPVGTQPDSEGFGMLRSRLQRLLAIQKEVLANSMRGL